MAEDHPLVGRPLRAEEIIALGRGRIPDGIVDDAWKHARRDCVCVNDRKPCSYHEGFLDGMDILTQLMEAI